MVEVPDEDAALADGEGEEEGVGGLVARVGVLEHVQEGDDAVASNGLQETGRTWNQRKGSWNTNRKKEKGSVL